MFLGDFGSLYVRAGVGVLLWAPRLMRHNASDFSGFSFSCDQLHNFIYGAMCLEWVAQRLIELKFVDVATALFATD